jgi:hypothetical protein
MSVEKTLKKLQQTMRAPSGAADQADPSMIITVPDDLATDDFRTLVLNQAESQLLASAEQEIAQDLRFEYLSRNDLARELRRFVCAAYSNRTADHVVDFVSRFAREPLEPRCYFPVLYLKVEEPYEIAGALLLPIAYERIPAAEWLDTAPPCGGVIAVPARGTNYKLMMQRARDHATYALGIARVTMRAFPWLNQAQLRFYLGESYAFDGTSAGWTLRDDAAVEVVLTEDMRRTIEAEALSQLPYRPRNDVEVKAKLALKWADRARLATDRLEATLYLFFALEGLLGDRAEGLKAFGLVFRRTILGHAVTRGFTNPGLLYYLYDEIRSYAVHGSEAPEVSRRDLSEFDLSVRLAMSEYLVFAQQKGLTRRSQVVAALNKHQDAREALQWLRDSDPRWNEFNPFATDEE